ncbi:DUF4331 family protein [Oscillatoria sp. FACHB-1407]|uniref:DUF4331 family protein n=1 Tax=Oscillatoria sp. FACHB-1407 TaxID=2692847 RepID=UPI0016882147|nr:DUF4331 family protein [Oscillatoria sp. FACHB-1407]MBD2465687.1 DUF4331 family protein [Oscillatoria sp. FACHB-1407]
MSDHFDGPRMLAEPVIDITDLYAFPSPETGRLVLVMNVFPFAGNSAFFSDGAIYKFRIRRAHIAYTGQKPAFDVDHQEFDFTFTFAAPTKENGSDQFVQQGTCTTPTGDTVSFQVHAPEGTQSPGLRMFAGLRLDPFFADVTWVLRTTKHHQVASSSGEDFINGANVLSIVVELEVATLLGIPDHSLFAIVAETWTAGKLPMRLARLGRPEIKNFTMSIPRADRVNQDLEIRDLYNQEDAFNLAPPYLSAYRARLNANLADWDQCDGKTDWQLDKEGNHPLTDLLLADFLIVDVSKPFSETSYFEIEQSMLKGIVHQTCGGRSLNDDIVDTMFTLYINAGNGDRISDGIDQAFKRANYQFPYLQAPNPTPPALPNFDRLAQILAEP